MPRRFAWPAPTSSVLHSPWLSACLPPYWPGARHNPSARKPKQAANPHQALPQQQTITPRRHSRRPRTTASGTYRPRTLRAPGSAASIRSPLRAPLIHCRPAAQRASESHSLGAGPPIGRAWHGHAEPRSRSHSSPRYRGLPLYSALTLRTLSRLPSQRPKRWPWNCPSAGKRLPDLLPSPDSPGGHHYD
jgi:hypothetical protein